MLALHRKRRGMGGTVDRRETTANAAGVLDLHNNWIGPLAAKNNGAIIFRRKERFEKMPKEPGQGGRAPTKRLFLSFGRDTLLTGV